MEPIDFETMLETPIEPIMFNRKYDKEFFLLSQIDTFERHAVTVLCGIMKYLSIRYKHGGLLIFVPYEDMKKVKGIIEDHDMEMCMFVEPIQENMLPIYKGARLYINTIDPDELCVPVLYCLNLGIPAVTTETRYIKKVFTGTLFTQYICNRGDVLDFCAKIIYLLEHDFAYNDYKMNTPTIIKNF